ncbi:hypothetical protein GCM10010435_88320 [Winogradskya consettensis]|uniref:Uncharacterized protein n=1 Tax=Winogradskya consettensis TaxID=113560 RepID=A0A919T4B5_9ACTN|nr:hypothetical protein Aco04nite_91330 [Actinoplanes consettensis]
MSLTAFHASQDPIMAESPHWRYIDNQRGCRLRRHQGPHGEQPAPGRHGLGHLPDCAPAPEFVVEAGRPGIAAVQKEPARARVAARWDGPIFDVHDDENAFPLRSQQRPLWTTVHCG